MAYLWLELDGAWAAARLGHTCYTLVPGRRPVARRAPAPDRSRASACLVGRRTGSGQERWVLFSRDARLQINGEPVWLGLRVLRDRDEIRLVSGERLYFSSERLAEVVPLPAPPRPVHCARCRKPIEAGEPAVLCPQCQTWHHQSDALPCWTYGERCALCPQPTSLSAGLHWSPA
jgi:hypothetical protein